LDVETTGLHSDDRVVSFAGILLKTEDLKQGELDLNFIHLIFDPGRKSHPKAEEVHGYSDWLLRHQDPFGEHVSMVENLIAQADLLVAHNAEFDLRFINAELAALGRPPVKKPVYCTMEGHRRLDMPGSASLSAIATRLGLARSGQVHSALEDAWLAMMAYLAQHECPYRAGFTT